MTFSDDDLKRLKECAYPTPNDNWIGLFNNISKSYEKFNLNALLARLEAAENYIEWLICFPPSYMNDRDTKNLKKAEETWRKVCGASDSEQKAGK